jgi:hypothetical protein
MFYVATLFMLYVSLLSMRNDAILIGSLAKECGPLDEIVHHKTIFELHPQVHLNVQLVMLLTCCPPLCC